MKHNSDIECFFCKEQNAIVLQQHHIIPISALLESGETVTLCANCHTKLHHIIRPLLKSLEEQKKIVIPEEHPMFNFLKDKGRGTSGWGIEEREITEKFGEEAKNDLEYLNGSGLIYSPKKGFWMVS